MPAATARRINVHIGEAVAKKLSITEARNKRYDRLIAENRGFAAAYGDFVDAVDLKALAIDPDEFLAGVRGEGPGCPVEL